MLNGLKVGHKNVKVEMVAMDYGYSKVRPASVRSVFRSKDQLGILVEKVHCFSCLLVISIVPSRGQK